MKQVVRLRNLSSSAQAGLEALVSSLAREHIAEHLQPPEAEEAILFATVERTLPGDLFRATLRLDLPGRTLVGREEDGDVGSAIEGGCKELETRLRRHLARLRRSDSDRAASDSRRLPRLEQTLPESPETTDQKAYFERVKEALPTLTRFVQRELAYLRSSGELSSDYPTVDDVVDEVLVRGLDAWKPGDDAPSSATGLLQLSIDVLAERVGEARAELLEGLALEGDDEIDATQALYYQEQFGDWQTERGGFESLVATSDASNPGEVAEFEQTRRFILEALRSLPVSWRRIVMLTQMDEQPEAAVADTLGIDEQTVRACLHHADAFLRQKLQEADIELPSSGVPADYLVIDQAYSLAAEEIEQELTKLLAVESER